MICGKPLWYWTFEAVRKCKGLFEDVFVNTDDHVLLREAIKWGFVPYLRAGELCSDDAMVADVMQSFCKSGLHKYVGKADNICLVSPTNPLRTHRHITAAVKRLNKCMRADAIVSVQKCSPSEQHLNLDAGRVITYGGCMAAYQTQNLGQCYRLTGSIVHAKWDVWAEKKKIYDSENCRVYGIDTGLWDVDVNTLDDLQIAEALLSWKIKRRTFFKNCINK